MKICIFLACSIFQLIFSPRGGTALSHKPTLDDIKMAMDKKMMLDEFTGNWSLDPNCVNSQSNRQLTLLGDEFAEWGANCFVGDHLLVGDLNRIIFALNHTQPFRDQLEKARDQCDFYMDHDFGLSDDHTKVSYFRLLFLWRPDETYSVFHVSLDINYEQPLNQSVVDFLNCAMLYGRRLDECERLVPKDRFSLDDYKAFAKWMSRAATTGFMHVQLAFYLYSLEMLKKYEPLLPHSYRPKKKCDLWPDYRFKDLPNSCANVTSVDPSFGSALRLYETWLIDPTLSHQIIRNAKRATVDYPGSLCSACSSRPMCSLSKQYFVKQLKQWVNQGSIDQWFYDILYQDAFNSTLSRDQPYFIRESFNMIPADNSTMHYARAMVYVDTKRDVYHVAMVSYQAKTKQPLIRVTPSTTCDEPTSVKCSYEMVRAQQYDEDVKKYLRYFAMNNIPE